MLGFSRTAVYRTIQIFSEQIKNNFQEKTGLQVTTKTIRKNLHELNIFSRIPAFKPLLNDKQRENRLNWCIERKDWSVRKWKSVIWSDESRFTIFKNDGPGRVWRTPGTRFNVKNMVPSIKHGGGGIMMWVVSQERDDNAPVHTAKNVKKWIETKKVKILENWPSQSPDLNPIEHLWSELERRIRKRPNPAKNVRELECALHEEWNQIPNNTLINLIESMPRRVEACIKNNGWPTKY
ncbi:IS630 family transposase [Rhizophagus irregularis DAOM 181602=DAOM 197198]|nr:IS630 family transposase [Rhizophagus irregularis DAOM 181602=DAOM 197198]